VNALRGPLRGGGDQRLLHCVFRRLEVAVPARHRTEHLRRKLAQQVLNTRINHLR
jgi:hypothetical protein